MNTKDSSFAPHSAPSDRKALTPESAAAPAFADLHTVSANAARSDDANAPRSESNSWNITVPECRSATISAMLGADDLATLSVGPISLNLGPRGPYGGGHYAEVSGSAPISPGTYRVETSYCNIALPEDMPNVAIFNYDIKLNVDGVEVVPQPVGIIPVDDDDEGDDQICPRSCDPQNPQPDCGCEGDENGAGDNGEVDSGAGCGGNAGVAGGAVAAAAVMMMGTGEEAGAAVSSSGAGRQVRARGGLQDMLWRMNFATFRGMAGVPDGALEIRAREFTPELCTPAALAFNHPFDSQVLASGGRAESPLQGAFQVRCGSSRVNYFCFADGLVAPLAGSAKRGGAGRLVSETDEESGAVSRFLSLQDARGCIARYDADENGAMGRLSTYTTRSGCCYAAADMASTLQVVRDEEGAIAQLWNAWDGLMVMDSVTETGYRMAFYLPHQVGAQDAVSGRFAVSGTPWRTMEVVGDVEHATLQLTDKVLERQPQVTRFICGADGAWSTEQGSDGAKICRHVVRERLEQEDAAAPETYRLVTTLHRGDINSPDECVAEIWQKGSTGHLCLSRTRGYGSPAAQTTLYEYDSEGRRIRETSPSGAVSTFTYDACGREIVRMTPYRDDTLAVYTYYRDSRSADPDVSYRRAVLNRTATQLRREDFTYEEQEGYRRVTRSTRALGCAEPRVDITETWLDSADEPLCRGRLRMRQGVDGVQTWYSYEACGEFGAAYKVSAETRVEGVPVPARSRREVTYVSAAGNNMRHEIYRLLSDGTWALTESESYVYDSENRWVERTRGNGRTSRRSMMCCGPLSETDEDGVTTTYGYNAAHQLEEEIRAEVQVDGVVVTPETITTYTRDAADRVLTTRRDVGAMTTQETVQYDLLGREVSRTDALERTTTTTYSADGLTTTVTTPAGATLITTRHADGTIAAVGGTGQRALVYEYSVQDNLLCTTVKLADEAGTLLSQTLTNGFGQTVRQVQSTTTGALLSTMSEYNAKGQLVRRYQQTQKPVAEGAEEAPEPIAMAPTLYEYDSFGNLTRQTLALSEEPDSTNSPVTEFAYTLEQTEEGIFACTAQTRYNAEGEALTRTQKQLISQLSSTLAEKEISINERGLTSTDWTVYNEGTKRTRYSSEPTSTITAETVMADGFVLSQKDTVGITTTATRSFTTEGKVLVETDGRGNATTTVTDKVGRTISVTDAAGNVTATAYDAPFDEPSIIIDAQGNTTCYRYDQRGRKTAEWGTAIQPACFTYDDADRLTSLTTFRAGTETISSDPSNRTDGDTTTWVYDPASGLELSKTYADGSSIAKTYDAFNHLTTETDARGNVKTHTYETARGLHLSTTYATVAGTAETAARHFSYNHLGQLTQVTDDSGTRTLGYNRYGEPETDSLVAGGVTHLITETRDAMGRSTGYTYARNGNVQQTVTTSYGTDGRITTAGFLHQGTEKQFNYNYLPGTNLLQTLTMPCNMTLTQSYEEKRNLLIGMVYKRGTTGVAERTYTYDTLGRPLTRRTARKGQTMNDSFVHNTRSELASAQINGTLYGYDYDNIGNRRMAMEAGNYAIYRTNALNQYTDITGAEKEEEYTFTPTFDADGNQTQVKTTTGIWTVTYNAENRPVRFTRSEEDGTETQVTCTYDYMGRRATKKVTTNGTVTLHQRYIYRDYLQIACCDQTRANHPCLWLITWEPTQPIATRPLAIQKDGTWYCYGWDLTKNICEVFSSNGYINTIYTYTPYGEVTSGGSTVQPLQWSSEYSDTELGLVYYNYRHYNPSDGRWICRDSISELKGDRNKYLIVANMMTSKSDYLGLFYAGNTSTDAAIKGLISGQITFEEALKLAGVSAAVLIALMEKYGKKAQCRPCRPPVGTMMEQQHDSHSHGGMCPHVHVFKVNQSPPALGCKCFAPKGKAFAKSQGYQKYEQPTGGGVIFV